MARNLIKYYIRAVAFPKYPLTTVFDYWCVESDETKRQKLWNND